MIPPAPAPSRTALQRTHLGGLLLAALPALAGQAALGRLVPGGEAPLQGLVLDLGYTCTGLSLAAVLHVALRLRSWRKGFRALPELARLPSFRKEAVHAALVLQVCTLAGLFYWSLAGARVERHARTFLLLAPVAYLVLLPRPSRLRREPLPRP